MQDFLLSDISKDDRLDGFLLVRSAEKRTSQNGSQYLDMSLGDRSGEINGKMWDGAQEPPPAGRVVRIRGQVTEYNGRLQLRVEKMRLAGDADDLPLDMLVPCAPQSPEEMLAEVHAAVDAMASDDLRGLLKAILQGIDTQIRYFPAAAKLHHAERSGLLHHITSMLRMANHYADEYPSLDRDLLVAGVIVHDLAKLTELNATELGTVSDYTRDGMLIGHLVRGVAQLEQTGKETGCDPELLLMLEHMVLSHHGIPEYGSPRPPMFPEAEVLNHLDMVDARIYEMNAALSRVTPGGFSERLWSLERKLYRRAREAQRPLDADGKEPYERT